jgi:hypothetical protein
MAKRIIKLSEQDLISFLEPMLQSSGYLSEDQHIEGFTYSTRKIRRDGDFYKDVINDPLDTSEAEEVKFIKVLATTKKRRPDAAADDPAGDDESG